MTDFPKRIPLARDSTPEKPRSWWDKRTMEHARRQPAPKRSDKRGAMDLGGEKLGGGYPLPQFNSDPTKSSVIAKIAADVRKRQAAEAAVANQTAAANRLVPHNGLTDFLGKVWAAPLTAVGSLAGAANVVTARIAGDKHARISVRDNGIQFESGYLGDKNRAFTLGNAVLHGPGSKAGNPNERYDGKPTRANTAEHEGGHSYQYQQPGFLPLYLLSELRRRLDGTPNPYEREADDFGDWTHRQKESRR